MKSPLLRRAAMALLVLSAALPASTLPVQAREKQFPAIVHLRHPDGREEIVNVSDLRFVYYDRRFVRHPTGFGKPADLEIRDLPREVRFHPGRGSGEAEVQRRSTRWSSRTGRKAGSAFCGWWSRAPPGAGSRRTGRAAISGTPTCPCCPISGGTSATGSSTSRFLLSWSRLSFTEPVLTQIDIQPPVWGPADRPPTCGDRGRRLPVSGIGKPWRPAILRPRRWPLSFLFFVSGFAGLTLEVVWARHLSLLTGSGVRASAAVVALTIAGLALGSRWAATRADRSSAPPGRLCPSRRDDRALGPRHSMAVPAASPAGPLPGRRKGPGRRGPGGREPRGDGAPSPAGDVSHGGHDPLPRAPRIPPLAPARDRSRRERDPPAPCWGPSTDGTLWEGPRGPWPRSSRSCPGWGWPGRSGWQAFWMPPSRPARSCSFGRLPALRETGDRTESPAGAASPSPRARPRAWILGAILAAGCLGGVCQLGWTRLLVLLFGSSTHALAITLAACLAGLAFGSAWAGRGLESGRPAESLARLALLGAAGATCASLFLWGKAPALIVLAQGRLGRSFAGALALQALLCILLLLPTAFALGALLPALTALLRGGGSRAGRDSGDAFSVDSWGSVLGALAAAFLLLPRWGVEGTLRATGFAEILLLLLLAAGIPGPRPSPAPLLRRAILPARLPASSRPPPGLGPGPDDLRAPPLRGVVRRREGAG